MASIECLSRVGIVEVYYPCRKSNAVAQSWHNPVAEKWGQRVRQVLRRERIRKVKRSQEFIHSLLVGTRVRGRYFDNGGLFIYTGARATLARRPE